MKSIESPFLQRLLLIAIVGGALLWQSHRFFVSDHEKVLREMAHADLAFLSERIQSQTREIQDQLTNYVRHQDGAISTDISLPRSFSDIWFFEQKSKNLFLRWHEGQRKLTSSELRSLQKNLIKDQEPSQVEEPTLSFLKIKKQVLVLQPVRQKKGFLVLAQLNNKEFSFQPLASWQRGDITISNQAGESFYSVGSDKEGGFSTSLSLPLTNLHLRWQNSSKSDFTFIFLRLLLVLLGATGLSLLMSKILFREKSFRVKVVEKREKDEVSPLPQGTVVDEAELRKKALQKMSQELIKRIIPPATSIIGQTKLIGVKKEGEDLKNKLTSIENSARRICDLGDRLSLFSEEKKIEMLPVDLSELTTKVLEFFKMKLEDLGVEVRFENDFTGCVESEPFLLQLILTELIDNSLESMFGQDRAVLHLYLEERQGQVFLKIEDSGCGIFNEDLPYIFEPFYTSDFSDRKKGEGLGLCVVTGAAKSLGVHLQISSAQSRKGTVVELTFPQVLEKKPESYEAIVGAEG